MKLLVICQHYYPEPFRISDICETLVKRGHEVTVITGVPNYPEGKTYSGYRRGKRRNETINGVRVIRTFTFPRGKGRIGRVLNYYSFAVSSSLKARFIKEKYDAVFVNQLSPVLMARAGLVYKRKNGVGLYLYCLDLWPESLCVDGIKKGGVVYSYYHRVSKKIYRTCDTIFVTSPDFTDYFEREFGIRGEKLVYLPQYAEDIYNPKNCKKAENTFVDLMFAGNIGSAQDMPCIIRAAALTSDINELRWHIVGSGSARAESEKLAKELSVERIMFYGSHLESEMPSFYRMSDAMIITLGKGETLFSTIPGKLQSCMASGKAILAAADGALAKVIKDAGCGWCAPSGDFHAFAQNVRRFCQDGMRERYGQAAYTYYIDNYSKDAFISKLEGELEK